MLDNQNKPKKKTCKRWRWFRGVLFGGFVATLLTSLFTPKSGEQLRKKILKVKTSGIKRGRILFRNSKQHTYQFAKQAKILAKNISEEVQSFTKSFLNENKE